MKSSSDFLTFAIGEHGQTFLLKRARRRNKTNWHRFERRKVRQYIYLGVWSAEE